MLACYSCVFLMLFSSLINYFHVVKFKSFPCESLQELRDLSSELYHAADYCKTAFLSSQDKRLTVETTKEYISRAVVAVVDHLGSISANLEYCISKSNSVPETELRIDSLKQRIGTCQLYSHKLALARFHWNAEFTRYHCRYILLTLRDSAMMSAVSRDSESCIDAKSEERNQIETKEPLFLDTYNCKLSLIESSTSDMEKNSGLSPPVNTTRDYKNCMKNQISTNQTMFQHRKGVSLIVLSLLFIVLPVHDCLPILPKAEHSTLQFQEAQKLKRSTINWKLIQNKDIASLIRRGKRILT
ncbi:hypothetical protein Pfo_000446 [Paulownia fortunei]|nr:hypothetical protein Pfo_000446 [Paulownia fortunei]